MTIRMGIERIWRVTPLTIGNNECNHPYICSLPIFFKGGVARRGKAGRGKAWLGEARRGTARHGEARIFKMGYCL